MALYPSAKAAQDGGSNLKVGVKVDEASEAPKVPTGWGVGRGCPLPTGEGSVFEFFISKWRILVDSEALI